MYRICFRLPEQERDSICGEANLDLQEATHFVEYLNEMPDDRFYWYEFIDNEGNVEET